MNPEPLSCDSPDCPYGGAPADRRGWHWDKSFNIGYLLTAMIMTAGFFLWAQTQERRMTMVEVGLKSEHDINLGQEASKIRSDDQQDSRLKRIEDKIDQLMMAGGPLSPRQKHLRSSEGDK